MRWVCAIASVFIVYSMLSHAALSGAPTDLRPQQYTCTEIAGAVVAAGDWSVKPDAFSNSSVVLTVGVQEYGSVEWSNGYNERGLARSTPTGFVIVVLGERDVEVYHFDASGLDLMMTKTLASDPALPNMAKALHGRCRPGRR